MPSFPESHLWFVELVEYYRRLVLNESEIFHAMNSTDSRAAYPSLPQLVETVQLSYRESDYQSISMCRRAVLMGSSKLK